MLNTPPLEPDYSHGFFPDGDVDEIRLPAKDHVLSSPAARAADRKASHPTVKIKEEDEDDVMEVAQAVGDLDAGTTSINFSGARPVREPRLAEAYLSPPTSSPTRPSTSELDASAWNDVTSKLNVVSAAESVNVGKLALENAVEQDGTLNFFWTDYTEANGSLCLFGKVKDRSNGNFVSAFAKIDGILRKLYFLPRTHRYSTFVV